MSRKVTFAKLKTRARRRADQEDIGPISDEEMGDYVNEEIVNYCSRVAGLGFPHRISTFTVSADGSEFYDLPDDFLHLVKATYSYGTDRIELRPTNITERHRYTGAGNTANQAGAYAIVSTEQIAFLPTPTSGTYQLDYVPVPDELTADTDTFGFVPFGDEWVVMRAAIACKTKEDIDAPWIKMKYDEVDMELYAAVTKTDLNFAGESIDVSGSKFRVGDWWPNNRGDW